VTREEAMKRMTVDLELRLKAGREVREVNALAVAEMKTDLESLQLCASERWGARKGFMRWSGNVAAKDEM
jgi:hypothetical protein